MSKNLPFKTHFTSPCKPLPKPPVPSAALLEALSPPHLLPLSAKACLKGHFANLYHLGLLGMPNQKMIRVKSVISNWCKSKRCNVKGQYWGWMSAVAGSGISQSPPVFILLGAAELPASVGYHRWSNLKSFQLIFLPPSFSSFTQLVNGGGVWLQIPCRILNYYVTVLCLWTRSLLLTPSSPNYSSAFLIFHSNRLVTILSEQNFVAEALERREQWRLWWLDHS